MSRSLNRITLIGNTGADPDVRTTQGGTKVARVSLATTRTWKDRNGGKQEATAWHRLTLWERLAEIAESYVRKGDRIYIEGRMEYGSYEKDGATIPTAEVVVTELIMLSGAGERDAAPARTGRSAPSPFDDSGDSLPF